MSTRLLSTLCVFGLLGVACVAPAEGEDGQAVSAAESPLTSEERQDLATARAATAKYHDVNVAIADGYIPEHVCQKSPAGGMGFHYFHPTYARTLDIAHPAILLYEPSADGPKLVGVEYFMPVFVGGRPWFAPTPPPPPPESNPAPVLFGQVFDGPMPGHNADMPWHYDLHVWIWKNNPSGLFDIWNPAVTCQ